MHSHQTRMIYMLSQCKDAKDNPACELSVFFAVFARKAQIAWVEKSELWRIFARKSETTMEDKVIVVVCGYPELYIHLRTFTKTGIHFAMRLELPGRSPSHDVYSRLLCSFTRECRELLAQMKRVNSKCSSVQLRANSAIYSRHSRLVWTHL